MSRLWRLGPEWLLAGFELAPQSEVPGTTECVQELKTTQSHALVTTEPNVSIESLLKTTEFSPLSKLLGTTAMVLRAVRHGEREAQPSLALLRPGSSFKLIKYAYLE